MLRRKRALFALWQKVCVSGELQTKSNEKRRKTYECFARWNISYTFASENNKTNEQCYTAQQITSIGGVAYNKSSRKLAQCMLSVKITECHS